MTSIPPGKAVNMTSPSLGQVAKTTYPSPGQTLKMTSLYLSKAGQHHHLQASTGLWLGYNGLRYGPDQVIAKSP